MLAIYRLTELQGSHRGGMNAAVDANVRGIAKTNDASPYTIANELIAARIGQTLGLPIPAGVVAQDETKKLYYLSLDVSYDGRKLPPIIPADFVQQEPWLAAGCVVFDILVANKDRNGENVASDPNFSPPRVTLLDHGHSLLGTDPPIGVDRLNQAAGTLGCMNVLMDQVSNDAHLVAWAQRVRMLPSYVFEDICADVARENRLNLSDDEAQQVAAWLAYRSQRVGRLICDHRGSFPAVTQWSLVEEEAREEAEEEPTEEEPAEEEPVENAEAQETEPSEADNEDAP